MEGLANFQIEIYNGITRNLINYKKSPKERITIEYIETRLETLEDHWSLFRANNSKFYEQFKLEDIAKTEYAKSEVYDKAEDNYINYKSTLKTTLNQLKKSNENHSNDNSNSGCNGASSSSLVKLPKIVIPTFSGNYSEWTTFRDLFLSMIHKNKALDNVQKLHYLKGYLSGEAEKLIRQIPITEANYSQCWTKLEQRFNNKLYLANAILKRFFGQRRATVKSAAAIKELLDTTTDCLSALQNIDVNVSTWDVIIIHVVSYKLDPDTRELWEIHFREKDSNEFPTYEQFKTFLESRFRALESVEPKKSISYQGNANHNTHQHNPKAFLNTSSASNMKCEFCSESHKLCFCKNFSKQTINERRNFVSKNNICFNCLGSNHTVYDCKKNTTCRVCKKRHHSLLHPSAPDADKKPNPLAIENTNSSVGDPKIVSCFSTGRVAISKQVLLATALVKAQSRDGDFQLVRALLDQGSQACFVNEAPVQFLRLRKVPVHGVVSGLGQDKSISTKHMVTLLVQSQIDPQFEVQINAYVLRNITSYLPENNLRPIDWIEIKDQQLADPQYNTSNKIDILLGADVYGSILKEGIMKSPTGSLVAQNTTLGWIISGAIDPVSPNNEKDPSCFTRNISVMHARVDLDDSIRKFWEIEDQFPKGKKMLTEEEKKCEDHFKATTRRTKDGRYIVNLPFKSEQPECTFGQSREIAVSRLKSLESKIR